MPAKVVVPGLRVQAFTIVNNGGIYAIAEATDKTDELWYAPVNGKPALLDTGLKGASAAALSPDGLWLFVAQSLSRSGLSYRVLADAKVDSKDPFYVPAWADDS